MQVSIFMLLRLNIVNPVHFFYNFFCLHLKKGELGLIKSKRCYTSRNWWYFMAFQIVVFSGEWNSHFLYFSIAYQVCDE